MTWSDGIIYWICLRALVLVNLGASRFDVRSVLLRLRFWLMEDIPMNSLFIVVLSKFRYLGVMVGECMYRHKAWEDTVVKLKNHLSKWKAKTLYIGGRKITWVAWDKVLASKKHEGLGVSSFHALNRALLLKWMWHFVMQDGSLWSRVIQALYGSSIGSHSVNSSSIWSSILRELQSLKDKGFDFGDMPLYLKFPRLFTLELDKDALVAVKMDRWICDLSGDGEFWVKEVRILLDDLFLSSFFEPTRWVKCVPIKINIFDCRACRDCLPIKSNLARTSVSLESSRCPLCDACEEDIHHVLFRCSLAQLILWRIVGGGNWSGSLGFLFRNG
nr:RNA-directed DNA polymerase, eukaryota [Tanacetum cinerariifolium]